MGGADDLVILTYSDEEIKDRYSVSLRGTTDEIVYETILEVYEEARDLFIRVVAAQPIAFTDAIELGLTRKP